MIDGKRIVITGGTGSLGQALTARLLKENPESITIFSRGEAKQHGMRIAFNDKRLRFVIGDVRDYEAVLGVVNSADIVIYAAALKHLSTCEANPVEARKTNIGGAENITKSVISGGASPDVVAGVSTDKACLPVNVYGITKFYQERIFIWANQNSNGTRFVSVRYGNVIGSNGSVIPLFQKQIRSGGPVTITEPTMTRFLITLELAVDTLFAAIDNALPGEIYIPRNLPAASIEDIASVMIGRQDIRVKYIGIQDREKLHEILISPEEKNKTIKWGGYYIVTPKVLSHPKNMVEYNSKDYVVSREKLIKIFKREGVI